MYERPNGPLSCTGPPPAPVSVSADVALPRGFSDDEQLARARGFGADLISGEELP